MRRKRSAGTSACPSVKACRSPLRSRRYLVAARDRSTTLPPTSAPVRFSGPYTTIFMAAPLAWLALSEKRPGGASLAAVERLAADFAHPEPARALRAGGVVGHERRR